MAGRRIKLGRGSMRMRLNLDVSKDLERVLAVMAPPAPPPMITMFLRPVLVDISVKLSVEVEERNFLWVL